MIHRRSKKEIAELQNSANVLIETFHLVDTLVEPGRKTGDIDREVEQFIRKSGGTPAFKGYRGFPASTCISIDEVVVHGIPDERVLKEGEIVGIDIGVELNGYFSDAARTYGVGAVSPEKKQLLTVTETALEKGIQQVRTGNRISDISRAVQTCAESEGFSVVRDMVGHGIGTSLHEEPEIPNFIDSRRGPMPRILEGMVFAIEPMINTGVFNISILQDGWTVVTNDHKPSAHFEHTVAVTEDGPLILTLGR